ARRGGGGMWGRTNARPSVVGGYFYPGLLPEAAGNRVRFHDDRVWAELGSDADQRFGEARNEIAPKQLRTPPAPRCLPRLPEPRVGSRRTRAPESTRARVRSADGGAAGRGSSTKVLAVCPAASSSPPDGPPGRSGP